MYYVIVLGAMSNYNFLIFKIFSLISREIIYFNVKNSCSPLNEESKNTIIYMKWIFFEDNNSIKI